MKQQSKLSAEQRKRLDRQRFIGLETQRKLLASRILIYPANGANTQLAKNLVLAGVNVTIYDEKIADESDFESNFLVALNEIGKSRGQAVFDRIKLMNPTGKNQFYFQSLNPSHLSSQFLDRFTIICTSISNFSTVSEWDRITKKANKPYYNIFCAGVYSSCFISLGSQYRYRQPAAKKDPKQYIVNSLSLQQCLDKAQVQKTRKRQFQILQAMIMMSQAELKGVNYDVSQPGKIEQEMLYCMLQLGRQVKEETEDDFLIDFAKFFGIEYCPVYSVVGSIVSQQIIKIVQNQQQPGMNWIVMNSDQGYCCVLKLKKQEEKIRSRLVAEIQL